MLLYFLSYSQEIEAIHKLRDATVVCTVCQLRLIIDNTHPNVEYCTCINKPKCAIVNSGNTSFIFLSIDLLT